MRNKLMLFFAPFLTFVVVGCGGEPAVGDASDELITLGQAAMPVDLTPETFTYYAVRPDTRKCIAPMCGGWFVRRVNRATTACADGTMHPECYVAAIDFDRLRLDPVTAQTFQEAATRSAVLLRATLVPRTYGHFGNLGQLVATEGWRAPNDNPPSGRVYRVHDTGILCYVAPCFSLRAERLNGFATTMLSNINFARTCASDKEVTLARAAMAKGWLLVAGYEHEVAGTGWHEPGLELIATQFWTRVMPAPVVPDHSCGGLTGKTCAAAEYCDITIENACHGADLTGVCKMTPQMCTMIYDPVCGCDGKTYGNDCARLGARVQLAYRGACVH